MTTAVTSSHGNPCAACSYSRNPQGGHCYMFREEPSDCQLGKRTIEADGFRAAQELVFKLSGGATRG